MVDVVVVVVVADRDNGEKWKGNCFEEEKKTLHDHNRCSIIGSGFFPPPISSRDKMATAPPHAILYHLAPAARWSSVAEGEDYKPETFEVDGFTHLTSDPSLLLAVGNSFYRPSKGDWLLLDLEVSKLGPREVKYEPAAPVGETQPSEELKKKQKGDGGGGDGDGEGAETLFPHLYGGIPKGAVVRERKVVRGEDGTFLGIEGM